jgi:hypothetical protein
MSIKRRRLDAEHAVLERRIQRVSARIDTSRDPIERGRLLTKFARLVGVNPTVQYDYFPPPPQHILDMDPELFWQGHYHQSWDENAQAKPDVQPDKPAV